MKITFTCEKCGANIGRATPTISHHGGFVTVTSLEPVPCPNCAKLTYGPLTEEMLAEAIVAVADKWIVSHKQALYGGVLYGDADSPVAMQKSLAADEARFVLRLLNEMESSADQSDFPFSFGKAREWLLDLARER